MPRIFPKEPNIGIMAHIDADKTATEHILHRCKP